MSSKPAHGEVYSIQHYVIKFVSDLQQFSPSSPVYSTNKTDRHNVTEILLKVVLNTINLTLTLYLMISIKSNKEHLYILFIKHNKKITDTRWTQMIFWFDNITTISQIQDQHKWCFDLCWSFIIQEQEKVYMKKDNNREINSKISF